MCPRATWRGGPHLLSRANQKVGKQRTAAEAIRRHARPGHCYGPTTTTTTTVRPGGHLLLFTTAVVDVHRSATTVYTYIIDDVLAANRVRYTAAVTASSSSNSHNCGGGHRERPVTVSSTAPALSTPPPPGIFRNSVRYRCGRATTLEGPRPVPHLNDRAPPTRGKKLGHGARRFLPLYQKKERSVFGHGMGPYARRSTFVAENTISRTFHSRTRVYQPSGERRQRSNR